jgi:hypothetical protein
MRSFRLRLAATTARPKFDRAKRKSTSPAGLNHRRREVRRFLLQEVSCAAQARRVPGDRSPRQRQKRPQRAARWQATGISSSRPGCRRQSERRGLSLASNHQARQPHRSKAVTVHVAGAGKYVVGHPSRNFVIGPAVGCIKCRARAGGAGVESEADQGIELILGQLGSSHVAANRELGVSNRERQLPVGLRDGDWTLQLSLGAWPQVRQYADARSTVVNWVVVEAKHGALSLSQRGHACCAHAHRFVCQT